MPRIARPPSHSELTGSLGADVFKSMAGRTLQEVIRRCDTKYRHWHKARFIAEDSGVDPQAAWLLLKIMRGSRRQSLPFSASDGSPVGYLIPDLVLQELSHIDRQLAGTITLDGQQPISETDRDRYIVSSLMEEAIASSKLEGASTLHRVAKAMLQRRRKPRNRDERMIVNNYQAILDIRHSQRNPLTPEFVIDLQRKLTEGTLDKPDESGRLRRASEDIVVADMEGNVLHEPPHASTLEDRLESLCTFANSEPGDAGRFIHPFIRACAVHFQLAYDHPFCDGNGRTARALSYWVMLHAGYWMFEFLPISRLICESPGEYQRAFQYVETDEYDLTYFLVYATRLVARARQDLSEYIGRKRQDQQKARELFDRKELNDRQRQMLIEFMNSPSRQFTIEEQQTIWGVSNFTARADLLHLEKLGYLNRRKVGKKFVFTASEPLSQ